MAQYSIQAVSYLGMSHCGEVSMEGNGFVELSDEEVATLVNLIKENHTTNVEELHLQERFPELFDKLDTAYYEIIHDAILYDALMEDFRNGYIEYDEEELMEYCGVHCGFLYIDHSGEDEEDETYYVFETWLTEFLEGLPVKDGILFFIKQMNADTSQYDIWDFEYTVSIPESIIKMVEEA